MLAESGLIDTNVAGFVCFQTSLFVSSNVDSKA